MKYVLRYDTIQDFYDAQGVNPGEDVQEPIPGVAYTDEAEIVDYNPIPIVEPTLIFVNTGDTDGEVWLVAREFGDMTKVGENRPAITINYSNNNVNFITSASSSNPLLGEQVGPFPLPAHGRLYMKGDNLTFGVGHIPTGDEINYGVVLNCKFWTFTCDVEHQLEGNLMALLSNDTGITRPFELVGLFDGDDLLTHVADSVLQTETIPVAAFAYLFRQTSTDTATTGLIEMPLMNATTVQDWGCYKMFQGAYFSTMRNLPATTLGTGSYYGMFEGSPNLTGCTPGLMVPNATFLDPDTAKTTYLTWAAMFANCTALTTPPTFLQDNGWARSMIGMFAGCTNLVEPPKFPALKDFYGNGNDNKATECCGYMFKGCTSLTGTPEFLGNITGHPQDLSYISYTGVIFSRYCFQYMFSGCTNLVSAGTLSPNVIYPFAYCEMFAGCEKLETPPDMSNLKRMWNGNNCPGMFKGCNLTSFPTLTGLYGTDFGASAFEGAFMGNSALTEAVFPTANYIGNYCFWSTFSGCSSLTSVTLGFNTANSIDETIEYTWKDDHEVEHTEIRPRYTWEWLAGVPNSEPNSGIILKNAANTSWDNTPNRDFSHVPSNWTVGNRPNRT